MFHAVVHGIIFSQQFDELEKSILFLRFLYYSNMPWKLGAAMLALVFVVPIIVSKRQEFDIVCYFDSWNVWREFPWNFSPRYVPVEKCTHVVYAFANLLNDGSNHF